MLTKLHAIGMGSPQFVTRDDYNREGKQGNCFIAVKTMRDHPKRKYQSVHPIHRYLFSAEECEKKKDTVFITLTGWKGMYNVNHPRYFVRNYNIEKLFLLESAILITFQSIGAFGVCEGTETKEADIHCTQ